MARPSNFKTEYIDLAYKYALLGITDAQLAEYFEVSERTLNTWKDKHPEFLQSLKAGKDVADAQVADKLFTRAMGYTYTEKKVVKVDGKIKEEVTIEKQVPPDTTAQIFWLKNRQSANWRDKQEVEHTGTVFKVTKKNVD